MLVYLAQAAGNGDIYPGRDAIQQYLFCDELHSDIVAGGARVTHGWGCSSEHQPELARAEHIAGLHGHGWPIGDRVAELDCYGAGEQASESSGLQLRRNAGRLYIDHHQWSELEPHQP